jgi:4a-hydroxytetrahydrobiopterin dehydratase
MHTMATLLDASLIVDALTALPGWSGDTGRLRRAVEVDAATSETVGTEIAAVADAMNHHPSVERAGDVTTFVLWTHSAGGVTELDITLASRISDILRAHGIPGTATAPTDAGAVPTPRADTGDA